MNLGRENSIGALIDNIGLYAYRFNEFGGIREIDVVSAGATITWSSVYEAKSFISAQLDSLISGNSYSWCAYKNHNQQWIQVSTGKI